MVTIKAAAQLTGLTAKAIRHYEAIGLCQPPQRTEAGYRLYSEEALFRLRRIRYFRDLKFSLEEIRALLDAPHEEIRAAMQHQRQVVTRQLEDCRRAKSVLDAALAAEMGVSLRRPAGSLRQVAVVVTDLQNDILQGGALPCRRINTILLPLKGLFQKARRLGVPVIYICDWHEKGDPELLLWNDHMMAGSWGAQIIQDVQPQEGDIILYKNLFNGFVNTGLQETLDALQVHTILFGGWRTDVCVAQTAIEAFYRGYHVVIAEDGVNSTTEGEHHSGMSLMRVNYGFETYPCHRALEAILGLDDEGAP